MLWPSFALLHFALLLSLYGHPLLCNAYASTLKSRSNPPQPLTIAPAGNWEGIDGSWNTYAVRVGTPETVVRLFISTAAYQTWVIAPQGCSSLSQQDCENNRGNDFATNASSTWKSQGQFQLFIEQNMGLDGPSDLGDFGYDTVGLEYDGSGGPTLQQQIVGVIATDDYYYGIFGLNPAPTNWSNFNDPSPSYMTNLKAANLIPSVSWGYTGGAQYRFSKVMSSLTLGGYDSSRFIPNDLTIPFNSDTSRELLVAVQNITAISNGLPTTGLIPPIFTSSLYAYIDSTLAEFWLPEEVCAVFENTFNLTYDSKTSLYLVSDSLHTQLLEMDPNITFTLGSQPVGGNTVEITLPYSAFDLTAAPPYSGVKNQTLYFPLRRAANSSQYTLGKAFLQEAYLIVDWERQNFSVSQVNWQANYNADIVPIKSINSTNSSTSPSSPSGPSMGLPTPAVIGIAVGVAVLLSIALFVTYFYFRRRRANAKAKSLVLDRENARTESPDSDDAQLVKLQQQNDQVIPKVELDANQNPFRPDTKDSSYYKPPIPGSSGESTICTIELVPVEADSKQKEIFEMPGDFPKLPEVDGRQMTEKEALRRREEQYNGVDSRSPAPTVSPIERRPTHVNPEDVREVIDRVGPRSERGLGSDRGPPSERTLPISPIEGSGSEGSQTLGTFSPMSPISSDPSNTLHSPQSPSTDRRRFSYEAED